MTRLATALAGAGLAVAVAVAPAEAATLVNAGGTLTYTGESSARSFVTIDSSASTPRFISIVRAEAVDTDPITASGCTPAEHGFVCDGVTSIVFDAGAGDDHVTVLTTIPTRVLGGAGQDELRGSGHGAILDGGAGDDLFATGLAADTLIGGPGVDEVTYAYIGTPDGAPVSITLDGLANDGTSGAGLNYGADIEDVAVEAIDVGPSWRGGAATLVGSDIPNQLHGTSGNDHLSGGGGSDGLFTGLGDDTIEARDGYADRVDCGPGADTAFVDQFDTVSGSCETVQTTAFGDRADDAPPTLAWAAAPARLTAAGGTISVEATDDHGIARVRFLDDGREICSGTSAPFSCEYRPRGADVGRNTLIAIATDALGQTASAVRVVTVARFEARGLTLRHSRGVARGTLRLPAGVTRAHGCRGEVRVGGRTVALRRDCTYRVRVKTRPRRAVFRGNAVLKPAASEVGRRRV